jgi:hypothetical protein
LREDGDLLLRAVVRTIDTVVEDRITEIAKTIELHQNYPNPFNASTKISFEIVSDELNFLRIADMSGKIVVERVYAKSGGYSIQWDGTGYGGKALASGVYIATLQSPGEMLSKKMTLLR